MSDYERNVAAAPFGQATGRAGSVAVDEGLRAYMLRIYNYMVLGLAITGAAALGTYMLSVTTDPSIAALKMRPCSASVAKNSQRGFPTARSPHGSPVRTECRMCAYAPRCQGCPMKMM